MISIKNPNRIAPKMYPHRNANNCADPELNKFHSMLPRARILKLFKEMRGQIFIDECIHIVKKHLL